MPRKIIIVFVLLLVAGFAFAEAKSADLKVEKIGKGETLTPPGTVLAQVGIGWPGISGGVEYMFSKVTIAEAVPLTFGGAGRAYVNALMGGLYFGGAGFGTVHFAWRSLELPANLSFLNPIDTYFGLGLGFSTYAGLGISQLLGSSYYLNKNLAIYFEDGYIGGFGKYSEVFATLGLVLKI